MNDKHGGCKYPPYLLNSCEFSYGLAPRSLYQARKIDLERRAGIWLACDLNMTVALLDDAMHDGQT